jgi:hypothetical protein
VEDTIELRDFTVIESGEIEMEFRKEQEQIYRIEKIKN